MMALHDILYWLSLATCAALAVAFWLPSVTAKVERFALVIALGVLTALIALRWVASGHPPVFGTFENTLAATWALLVLLLWVHVGRGREPHIMHMRLLVLWLPATLLYGFFFSSEPLPLTISERSIWIDVHVTFAWGAYAFLLSACMAALGRLLPPGSEDVETLDWWIIRGLGVGFALFSGLLAVGAFYGYELFAEWFRWELVEVLSVAAWLAYGLAVHAWLLFGWRGKRIAVVVLGTLPLLLLAFWSWSIYSGTYHYFDIVPFKAM